MSSSWSLRAGLHHPNTHGTRPPQALTAPREPGELNSRESQQSRDTRNPPPLDGVQTRTGPPFGTRTPAAESPPARNQVERAIKKPSGRLRKSVLEHIVLTAQQDCCPQTVLRPLRYWHGRAAPSGCGTCRSRPQVSICWNSQLYDRSYLGQVGLLAPSRESESKHLTAQASTSIHKDNSLFGVMHHKNCLTAKRN